MSNENMGTMNLKDFIRETLLNITAGVKEANGGTDEFYFSMKEGGVHRIEFDVSIGVTERSEDGGQLALGVPNLGLGAKLGTTSDTDNSKLSRISFKISVKDLKESPKTEEEVETEKKRAENLRIAMEHNKEISDKYNQTF